MLSISKSMVRLWVLSVALLLAMEGHASSEPSIEAYGLLPQTRSFAISPDGSRYAFIRRKGTTDYFAVMDAQSLEYVASFDASKIKAKLVRFLTNKHVVFYGTKTQRSTSYRGEWEGGGTYVYNLETRKLKQLLANTKGLHPAQAGLGRVVGFNSAEEVVYMPAYADQRRDPPNNLYRVSLKTGSGKLHVRGNRSTRDWFVDADGKVLARVDYVKSKQEHKIYSRVSGNWQLIYSRQSPTLGIDVKGVSADNGSLLFVDKKEDREAVYKMSLADGAIEGPVFGRDDADIDGVVSDANRRVRAIEYSGFTPEYQFIDETLNRTVARVAASFPMSSVRYAGATADQNKIVFWVSGMSAANKYALFDVAENNLSFLATEYPAVKQLGVLKAVNFTARDGLKIPAVITFPPGKEGAKDLPLIALPHGGPEAYDRVLFDWWAQYLAAKGYLVVQPNFRGSTGFGYAHRNAGHGKWGREMQDDVSDAVASLVAVGYADADKVCIMGASYGGYSALAGGAFTPDLYRCVVSVNGVSDLPAMLSRETRRGGSKHWVVSYWKELIGDAKREREKLVSISPVHAAADFKAPVLLVHGEDDTVVPIKQSLSMEAALKAAGKPVELVVLEGEDHHLSSSRTRLAMLQAIDDFLTEHNPINE